MASQQETTIWVLSNRVDDRIVLHELDEAHPGGEAFVGGSTPAHVARTPRVIGLLREGLLIEIPEPPDGPKKPVPVTAEAPSGVAPNQPGQAIRLGRTPDPDLVPEGALAKVAEQQARAGEAVPVPSKVIVPPAPEPERTQTRR